jgi:hypothetical protein
MFSRPLLTSLCPTEWQHLVWKQYEIFFALIMKLSLYFFSMTFTLCTRLVGYCLVIWDAISKSMQRVRNYWLSNDDWPTGVLVSIQLNWSSLTSCATQLKSTLNMEGRPREIRKRETTDGPYAAWRMVRCSLHGESLELSNYRSDFDQTLPDCGQTPKLNDPKVSRFNFGFRQR